MGLGELYAYFHGGSHRLIIAENSGNALALIENKWANDSAPGTHDLHKKNRDKGFISRVGTLDGGMDYHLTVHAQNYKEPMLGHEMAHRIDSIEGDGITTLSGCYSQNTLFEYALVHDLSALKRFPKIITRDILQQIAEIANVPANKTKAIDFDDMRGSRLLPYCMLITIIAKVGIHKCLLRSMIYSSFPDFDLPASRAWTAHAVDTHRQRRAPQHRARGAASDAWPSFPPPLSPLPLPPL